MNAMDDAPTTAAPVNWKALLGELGLTRMRLDVHAPQLYPLTIPHVGATADQVAAAEQRLGHPLDGLHRQLLTYANGWEQMFVHTDLLATDELGAPGVWTQTRDLLVSLEEDWPPGYLPPVGELDIVAASANTADIFLVWRTGPVTDGGHPVLWLGSGQLIEQWANVADMLRAVLEYTRRTEQDAAAKRSPFDRI